MLASGSDDHSVRVWKFNADSLLANLSSTQVLWGAQGAVWDVAWSPDGSRLAAASTNSNVLVWSVADGGMLGGQPPEVLKGHTDMVWCLVWSPDGTKLVSGSQDGTARVWEVYSDGWINPDSVQTVQLGENDYASSITFHPSGSLVAMTMVESQCTWVYPVTQDGLLVAENAQVVSGHAGV
eukprot:scaffold154880_cov40-Prasinocladus_malaysianus.AAC.2